MISVIGGTGKLGQGLVARLVMKGHDVIIGSRTPEKAELIAKELGNEINKDITWGENKEAALKSEIIILSVPFKGMEKIINQIKASLSPGDIVVSVVVPFLFKENQVVIPKLGHASAAEKIDSLIPEKVSVISTLQTVSANHMRELNEPLDADIPVCGDDQEAKKEVMDLIEELPGARTIDAGKLGNSALIESLAVLLIDLTLRHKVKGVGVKFEGL